MGHHTDLEGPQGIHVPHDFEYADEAARLAATGFVTGDLKKLALQLDNFSLWILTAVTPTWVRLGNAAGSGDVVGPGSSTDNALARFDSTTGQLLQNSNALLDDAGALTIVGAITSEARRVSTIPIIVEEIFASADLDALATAGVITVTAGTQMVIRLNATSITSANRFVVEDGASLTIEGLRLSTLVYSGVATLFTVATGSLRLTQTQFVAVAGGTFIDMTSLDPVNAQFTMDRCFLVAWELGSIDRAFVLMTFSAIFDWESGFTITNTRLLNVSGIAFGQFDMAAVSDSLFNINTHDPFAVINLHFLTGRLPTGDFLANIDAGLHNDAKAVVEASVLNGVMFDTSGSTGTFSAVADATVAATTINSVIDSPSSPGIARFNFTVGPTLFINQYVEISSFVTNTAYNMNGLISATGAGFFEVTPIAFGTTEVGSFRSDSVTITDVGTSLTDGEGITLSVDGDTDYDGGGIVYNQLVNSFEVHRVWTVTHSGTWSTEGLDEVDPRVITQGNPGQHDSSHIASGFVNGNATANPAIVNGVFSDMAFGTAGSALIAGSNMERWKLIDDVLGIFEYTGNEPFEGEIFFSHTSVSSGGSVEFQWKWVHDIGAGFVILQDDVITSNDIGSAAQNTAGVTPLTVNKGDRIKPQITRISGSSSITTTHASIGVE